MSFLKLQNSTLYCSPLAVSFSRCIAGVACISRNIQGDDHRLRTMIGISSKSPQLTNPEMEDRGSARSYNRSIENLIKFFTSRKTAKANHTSKPGSLRQDSNVTSIQPAHRTATTPKSGLKTDRSSSNSPDERRTQRRARFEDSLPTVSTGDSFEEEVKKAAGLDRQTGPSIADNDEEEDLLDARLQEARDRCKKGIRPAHAVAWVGSNVNKPHQTRRCPGLPRNGFRDVLFNAERRVAKTRVRTLNGRTQLLPFLANGTSQNVLQGRRAGDVTVSSSSNTHSVAHVPRLRSNDSDAHPIEAHSNEGHLDRSLLLLARDRTNSPQPAYLRAPLEQMIRTLERKTSIDLTSGLDSTCKTGVWNEYDQALLDLSRMIDDEVTTTRMEQSLETINSRPQHLANQPTTNLNKIQLRRLWWNSSSVHPRSINSTPPSLERPIDSLATSPVETNPFEPSEGQGSSYPRKPPIPPRAPTRPTTPYSPSFDPKAKTTPQQPSEHSIPSLLVEAKTSNITRQLLFVTESPQDKDGMRDSGVGVWTEEEICFVRAGIAFADGLGG